LAKEEEGPAAELLSDLFGGLRELLIFHRLPPAPVVWIIEKREL
jgi:hypothetical protein